MEGDLTAGGPDKVNVILHTMGNTAEETVLEPTEDRPSLPDKDGRTKYDGRRVRSDVPAGG